VLRQNQPPRRRPHAGKVLGLERLDAPEGGRGKPCGASHITRTHKCRKTSSKVGRNVALGAGAIGLAALAATLYAKQPKLSRQTREALKANQEVSALDVLSSNKNKDIITAKFKNANEFISLSTINGRDIEVRAEGARNDFIITFRVDNSLTRKQPASPSDTRAILARVREMITEQVTYLPRGAQLYAEPVTADGSARARGAIYKRWGFKDAGDGIGLTMPASAWRSARTDAAPSRQGKPCGASHIPKAHKCSKKAASPTNNTLRTAAKIALAVGAVAGGAYLIKRSQISKEAWENSPHNTRKNPKLSPEEAQRIADEAIAGGQKWDVQEQINARRIAECGGGLGKIQAPAKFDAAVFNPRCQAGAGAFGTYFVHNSEKYGIKVFRNGDEDDVQWEFDRLDKAHFAGVNVPQPLALNATRDPDGEVRSQTLILSHMRGYKTLSSEYRNADGTASGTPLIVQRKIAMEFRKLHTAGLAHGDIHDGNIMVHPRSKKIALVDFGYSTELDDRYQPQNSRTGVDNLLYDMRRLPEFLGFSDRGSDFLRRYKGVLDNVEEQANFSLTNYDRDGKFELAVKRYHDALETELLWDDRRPRSRFISGADQPRIPGLTRRLLTANLNTFQRGVLEQVAVQQPTFFQEGAKNLGVKPGRLHLALKPERAARLAKQRKQPFGTPIA
jgi:hypothetical protein